MLFLRLSIGLCSQTFFVFCFWVEKIIQLYVFFCGIRIKYFSCLYFVVSFLCLFNIFIQTQLGICWVLSWSFLSSFIHVFQLIGGRIVFLSNCFLVEFCSYQIVFLSNCVIVKLCSSQIVFLSNCGLVKLWSCQIVLLSNYVRVKLNSCRIELLTN